MKNILIFFILIFSLTLFAQTANVAGNYTFKLDSNDTSKIEYQLALNQDGTFSIHYYLFIPNRIPPELNLYGKGTWKEENNVISFFTDKQKDIDEKYTLDFNDTKARFKTKSPRDKTDKIIKTKLQFLKSEINWMQRVDLIKI